MDEVFSYLSSIPNLAGLIGDGLRRAFDEVIDGPRTGRYKIEDLEKTEKTYIGTKVEIVIRNALNLHRGQLLDNLVCGHEVDTKFSLSGGWMIPREAVAQLCLLVQGNDNSGQFSVGLLRMASDVLTVGANQDQKRSVSAAGKQRIRWILQGAPMPRNFILDLDDDIRALVLSASSGRQRIRTLFENVTGRLIPRSAILQVAQQKDSLKRAREAKALMAAEGYKVLCATYDVDRLEFLRYGFRTFNDDDWLCVHLDE
jgi:hypothetical protein